MHWFGVSILLRFSPLFQKLKFYFLIILESNTKLIHLLKNKKCSIWSIYLCHMQTIMNFKKQRNQCIMVEQYKCRATNLKFYLQVSVSQPFWVQWCCTSIMQGRTWSSAMSSQEPRNDFKSVYNDSFLLASRISKTLCKEPHNCFIILLLRVGFSAIVLGNCFWPQYLKRSLLQYFGSLNYSRNSGSKFSTSFFTAKKKPDKISSTP